MSRTIGVVGAGILGLSAAFELTRSGQRVAVLEAEHAAYGSSGRSVGIVGTQQLTRIAIGMRTLNASILRDHEADGLVVNRIGYVRLGRTAGIEQVFAKSVALQRELGVRDARVLTQREVEKLIPDLYCADVVSALHGPSDGYIDGHELCSLLAEKVKNNGGRVLSGARVHGAEKTRSGYQVAASHGVEKFDAVVLATGGWARGTAREFGSYLPVQAERHHAVTVELGRVLPYRMPFVMDYVEGHGGSGLNFRHERDGQLIVEMHAASGTIVDPDQYSSSIDNADLAELAQQMTHRLPTFHDASFGRGWAGIYPTTPDHKPLVGPLDEDGILFAATGAGGYGVQTGVAIGRLVSEWVLHGKPISLPEADEFDPRRFLGDAAKGDQ